MKLKMLEKKEKGKEENLNFGFDRNQIIWNSTEAFFLSKSNKGHA